MFFTTFTCQTHDTDSGKSDAGDIVNVNRFYSAAG